MSQISPIILVTKYCLLHGDYRAHFNIVMTKNSKMVVMDWEDAEIGDPAYDVAMAYTRARADFGEKTADRFIQEYLKYFDGNISERLFFYKLMGICAWLFLTVQFCQIHLGPMRFVV